MIRNRIRQAVVVIGVAVTLSAPALTSAAGRTRAGARAADRSHLPGERVRAAALRSGAMARRRHRLHHGRAIARRRGLRHRSLRRRDRRAQRADLERAADAAGRTASARDRRLRVVGRCDQAADLHEHAEGVAPEHARRLLGAEHQGRRPQAARRRRAGSVVDVREVLAGCDARRLRARQQHLCRAAGRWPRDAADERRLGDDHQRHLRLGLRRRVRRPRRLPLQSRRPSRSPTGSSTAPASASSR